MCYGYFWAEGSKGLFLAPGTIGTGPNVQEGCEESPEIGHQLLESPDCPPGAPESAAQSESGVVFDRSPHLSLPTSNKEDLSDEETKAQSKAPHPARGAGLTASGLELIRAVSTLLLAITLPPLRDAVAIVTGEVTVHAGLLGCGVRRRV